MEKTADAVLATPWWQASDADLLAAVGEVEELHRRAYAATLAVHAEVRSRGLTGGYESTRVLVHDAARISVVQARRRETHLDLLATSPDGQAALDAGLIGADHLDVIVKTLAQIPADVDLEERVQAETSLVEHARVLDARELRYAGRQILAWLDQDGPEPAEDPVEASVNELHLDTFRDGRV
ncbi:MAG TPA: DUF222 domain-containing protein, partial [Pseudonocardiaceae bacterium]